MGQSNSKLSDKQKENLRDFKANNEGYFEFIQNPLWGFTLLLIDDEGEYRVSASYQSEDEQKFRKKVGQYWAMTRMYNQERRYIDQDTFNLWYRNNPAALAKLAERIVFKR